MSPWTLVLVGGVMTLLGGVITTYGLSLLRQKEEAFSLSVPPSIDVSLRPKELVFRNTGQHSLKDVKVWAVLYEAKVFDVVHRSIATDGQMIADNWEPQTEILRPSEQFASFWDLPELPKDHNYYLALVTVYRRKADNRRFVEVTPFMLAKMPDQSRVLFPVGIGSSGPPQDMLKAPKEIIETEKFFFKAN